MERIKISLSDAPSLATTRQRISPYRKTGVYMELHKLDYEKKQLEAKLEKKEFEIAGIKKRIGIIENDMAELLPQQPHQTSSDLSPNNTLSGKSLKY